jgi:PhzF family phenazine biosynthesis protein
MAQISLRLDINVGAGSLSVIPTAMVGAIGAYPDGSEHAFEIRTFAPGVGVAEGPVCGSMNASVGQWLTTTGAAPSTYRGSQGARVGRAGTIQITADADGTVRVWGAPGCIRGCVLCGRLVDVC